MKKISIFIRYFSSLLFVNPVLLVKTLWNTILIGKIAGIKQDNILQIYNHNFTIPNFFDAYYTIAEVFHYKLYRKLVGLNSILDLGGYLGESAIFLSKYNNNVVVVEAEKSNYSYLTLNCRYYQNINPLFAAVVGKKEIKEVYFNKGIENDTGGTISGINTINLSVVTPALFIGDIVANNIFDGLKMDVEGAEYDIIEFFVQTLVFPFIKGYIEFHNVALHHSNIQQFQKFLTKGYTLFYETIHGNMIQSSDIFEKNMFVLYFEK